MRPDAVLVVVIGVLCATGVALLLERSLTRVVLGLVLFGNGVNLLILTAGRAGGAAIVGVTTVGEMSDPLPQAMVLTAIVVTFGVTGFLLALSYRTWQLRGHDEVQDDLEDRRISRLAESGGGVVDEAGGDERQPPGPLTGGAERSNQAGGPGEAGSPGEAGRSGEAGTSG